METREMLQRIEAEVAASLPACGGPLAFVREILSYSLESGGKRVRPLLCLMFCEACGGEPERALAFAAAVEYVHTYSLIHDDLPCMDDDDYRRGRLSSHKKFGEANAVLAGDALLTHAFSLIASAAARGDVSDAAAVRAAAALSRLAGADGMVGGQYLDILYEGKRPGEDALFTMDALKTGALIEAACTLGCLAAGADAARIGAAAAFALHLGVAFQLVDDILEYESAEEHSDEKNEKSTYIALLGPQETKRRAAEHTERAVAALEAFGGAGARLRAFALELLGRRA